MQTPKNDFTAKLFSTFGNLRYSTKPLFLSYSPQTFALKGGHTREIMKRVQIGDILVRSYNNYLDGFFVPGTFTHVGLYLGPVTEDNLRKIAKVDLSSTHINPGDQTVIHAIGNQVYLDHLIDFCRCDGLAIMRFPRQLKATSGQSIPDHLHAYLADPTQSSVSEASPPPAEEEEPKKGKKAKQKKAEEPVAAPEPVKLDDETLKLIENEKKIAYALAQGKAVDFQQIQKLLYLIALKQLKAPSNYDFGFDHFPGTACTELVYFITKSICWLNDLHPTPQKVFFKSRRVILPDAFVDCGLEEVWKEVH